MSGSAVYAPAVTLRVAGVDADGWLVGVAVGAAVGGLCVSVVVGRKLVMLEVENQRVEARLCTKLVVLEQTPTLIVGRKGTSKQSASCSTPASVYLFHIKLHFCP